MSRRLPSLGRHPSRGPANFTMPSSSPSKLRSSATIRSVGSQRWPSPAGCGSVPKNSRETHASLPSRRCRSPTRNRSSCETRRRHTAPGSGLRANPKGEASSGRPARTTTVGFSDSSRSVITTRSNPIRYSCSAVSCTRASVVSARSIASNNSVSDSADRQRGGGMIGDIGPQKTNGQRRSKQDTDQLA